MKYLNLIYILLNILYISGDFRNVEAVVTSDQHVNKTTNDIVISYENECRELCERCDCKGFFCGDNECICECNANINVLNKYAECLKDIIKDNYYRYNISVQHLNVPPTIDLKKSEMSKKLVDGNRMVKKRSVVGEMEPEATNLEKEKIFKATDTTDFKFPPLNLDFVGSPFAGLKTLGDSLKLPNLGIGKTPSVAAAAPDTSASPATSAVPATLALPGTLALPTLAVPATLGLPPTLASPVVIPPATLAAPAVLSSPVKDQVSDPAPAVVVAAPAPGVVIAAPAPAVAPTVSSTSSQKVVPVDTPLGIGVLKAPAPLKPFELGKMSGLLGIIQGLKANSVASPLAADKPVITQPTQT